MIPLKKALTSSLGQKFLMALSGLGLVAFTIIHLLGNLSLYLRDGSTFNHYAAKLESFGPLLLIAEVGPARRHPPARLPRDHAEEEQPRGPLGGRVPELAIQGRRGFQQRVFAQYADHGAGAARVPGAPYLAVPVRAGRDRRLRFPGQGRIDPRPPSPGARDLRQPALRRHLHGLDGDPRPCTCATASGARSNPWARRGPGRRALCTGSACLVAVVLAVGFFFIPIWMYFGGVAAAPTTLQ